MNSEKFYNNYLQNSYNQNLSNRNEGKQHKDYIVKNFKAFLPREKKAHILDIGIGNGRTLKALKELGFADCFGIDIAEDLIEEAKRKGLECEYIEDTNAFLDSNRGKYAFVFLSHVIEHVSKKEAVIFLEKIRGSLTEDGILAIVTPSVQNIFYLGPFWDFTHVNFFTERSLYQLCEVAGFKNIQLFDEKLPIDKYGKGISLFLVFFIGDIVIKISRFLISVFIRGIRAIIGSLNPKIMSFNIVCICKKR